MLKNYLTVALRHLRRGRAFTLINIAGLALGLASCLLIVLFVQDELSYDRFFDNADRIYRLTQPDAIDTPPPLAPALTQAHPGVQTYARVLPMPGDMLIREPVSDKRFYESRLYMVDSTIFDVFSFDFLQGDPTQALNARWNVVITEDIARKYFGDDDPMGQTLVFDVGIQVDMLITGVMRTPPHNSHFRPDFLVTLFLREEVEADWNHPSLHSYVVLGPAQQAEALQEALPALAETYAGETGLDFSLQPITAIHLHSKLPGEFEAAGSMAYVYSFSAIALLILLIACVNFINLATARSAHRAREIGMRKVLGAQRGSLVGQFLGESVLLTLLSMALAVPLVAFLLPLFNTLADKTLTLRALNVPFLLLVLVVMTGLVGMVAGSYPAFFLARFAPLRTLRGKLSLDASGLGVRKVLVVTQFCIGIVLILGTLVIYDQLHFVRAKDLGFEKEQTVVISARMYGHAPEPLPSESMQQAFSAHAGVLQAAATANVPGTNPRQAFFFLEGMTSQDDMTRTEWNLYTVDYDFVETMGFEVIEGRSFSREVPADETRAFLINEAALREARKMAGSIWDAPIDKKLDRYSRVRSAWILGKPGRIIGVVRDFNYQSLHHQVAPLVMQLNPGRRDQFVVRLGSGDLPATLAHLEATWKAFIPDRPFEYYFLDAAFDRLYRAEQRTATLLGIFTGLSLIIACLGLLGLAAATAEQRTKEIGVRKALGASLTDIVVLLSKGFAGLVLLAFVIAIPLAYFGTTWWLDNFAYRIEISWGIFLTAGLAALGIALLTVGYQAVKAAMADPVESLRYE